MFADYCCFASRYSSYCALNQVKIGVASNSPLRGVKALTVLLHRFDNYDGGPVLDTYHGLSERDSRLLGMPLRSGSPPQCRHVTRVRPGKYSAVGPLQCGRTTTVLHRRYVWARYRLPDGADQPINTCKICFDRHLDYQINYL